MIDGDQHQLCQVFTNLLTNAFEALDGKGRIAITRGRRARSKPTRRSPAMQPPTPTVVVDVADDGPGVPADLTRSGSSTRSSRPSRRAPGLGLAIVRKIVDAHDGRIDLSSSAGHGHAVPRHAAGDERHRAWFK